MLSHIRALLALITAIVVTAIAAILTGIGGGGTGPSPTSTTSSSSTSSSTSTSTPSSTSSTGPGSTTSTAPGSTTTTIPGPGTAGAADFTRLRFVITNELDWFTFALEGLPIRASRVVSTTGTLRVTSLGPTLSVAGSGEGVVDVVVEVGDDGSYELETCGSPVGSTSVDLHRMTDGDVSLATIENDGTSNTPDAGGCYNAERADVDRDDLLGSTPWPTLADPRRLVLAMYFPWFTNEDFARDFGDSPVPGIPLDTSSPAVVADAVAEAADAGIDGFIVEWAAQPFNEAARIDAVYAAAGEGDFEVALMLDFAILHAQDGLVGDTDLDIAFAAVAARASQPAQLEVDGQPVVFVYGSNRVDPARWEQAKARLVATTGLQPYFIDQLDRLSAEGRFHYGSQGWADRDALFGYARDALYHYRLLPGLLGDTPRLWVHPVQPGYDDSRLGRSNPTVMPRAGGQRYVDAWESALVARPDWIFLSTWNDYLEQTHILPGDESGTTALDQTPEWTNVFHAQP